MRALSLRAASRCEHAVHPQCRCRCGGKLHGAARVARDAPREKYFELPEGDPHNPKTKLEGQIELGATHRPRETFRLRDPKKLLASAARYLHCLLKGNGEQLHGSEVLPYFLSEHMLRHLAHGVGPCLRCGQWLDKDWKWLPPQV